MKRMRFPATLIIAILFLSSIGFKPIFDVNAQNSEGPYLYADIVGPPADGNCYMWASDSQVNLGGKTAIWMWWDDLGWTEYYVVVYETYPDGSVRRYPPSGYFGPYKNPGNNRALTGYFRGDVEGTHYLYFQLYNTWGDLLCTSNTISIDVIKKKEGSSISLFALPTKVERGQAVRLTGSISPAVSATVTVDIIGPSGSVRMNVQAVNGHFELTYTPTEMGNYSARASWSGNKDYLGALSPFVHFEALPKKYEIKVSTQPTNLPILVDGKQYDGSASFMLEEDTTHTITVNKVVKKGKGVRYVFEKWSDGLTSPSRTIKVAGPENYVALFSREFHISVETEYGDVVGPGWYPEGKSVRIKLRTPIIDFGNDTRVVFTRWSGDVESTDTEIWIKADKHYEIKADWKKQYRIDLGTHLSAIRIEGGKWQDSGAESEVSVTTTRLGFLVEDVFDGFTVIRGKCSILSQDIEEGKGIIKVNGPCLVEAKWRKDYTKLTIVIPLIIAIVGLIVLLAKKGRLNLPGRFGLPKKREPENEERLKD